MKVKRKIEDRKHVIGSSSAAAHLGLSGFRTPYDAYLEFIGESPEPTEEEKARFEMGHDLEDFIAKQAEKKYGIKVRRSNFAFIDPKRPHLLCHPDRLVAEDKALGERIALEIKSNTAFDKRWGKEDTDEIPMDYLVQCMMYFICGVPCDAVWLIRFSNNTLYRYIIRPDRELMESIATKLEGIAERILSGWKPEASTYQEAVALISAPSEGAIEADDIIAGKVERLGQIRDEKKTLEQEEDGLKRDIILYMDGMSHLTRQGKTIAKYSTISTTRFDSKRFGMDHPDLYSEYLVSSSYSKLS